MDRHMARLRPVAGDDADRLLGRFAADAGDVVPLIALWAHGSLALGDFVPGRSDLDLVALIGAGRDHPPGRTAHHQAGSP
jgi:hypothetical protein